jgi:hypothetical protein
MPKGIILVIAPHRNAGAKGIMQSRGSMMDDPEDQTDQGADEDTEDQGGGGTGTCSVPISAISVDGTSPAPGDKVNFSIEGIVGDVSGGMADVQIKSIDGQATENDASENSQEGPGGSSGSPESLSAMGSRLRKKAAMSSGGIGGGY